MARHTVDKFGHVMHVLCSKTKFSRFAGTRVERDFVEAPSQMLENWCFEPAPLALMSGHKDDPSIPLPVEMAKALQASKVANAGMLSKRQLLFGLFDQVDGEKAERRSMS